MNVVRQDVPYRFEVCAVILLQLKSRLPGIDDPTVVQEIEQQTYKRILRTFGDGVPLLIFLLVNIAFVAVGDLLDLNRWQIWLTAPPMLVVTWLLIRYWLRRKAAKVLPEILQSMDRCVYCGYKLDPDTQQQCPECGLAGAPINNAE